MSNALRLARIRNSKYNIIVAKAEKVLELIRNKSKRVYLALNPQLWSLFEKCVAKEKVAPTHKIEELIISYLDTNGYLDE